MVYVYGICGFRKGERTGGGRREEERGRRDVVYVYGFGEVWVWIEEPTALHKCDVYAQCEVYHQHQSPIDHILDLVG